MELVKTVVTLIIILVAAIEEFKGKTEMAILNLCWAIFLNVC